MNQMRPETLAVEDTAPPRLGEIGLANFAPYLMNRIMGRYNEDLREELASMGLTIPKMRSLAVLSVIDGLLIRDLSVYAVVEQSTLSRALDQLLADGLIRKAPDAEDSRATRVFITDAGRGSFERLWPSMAGNYAKMFQDIPDVERAQFVATLQKMLGNVRRHNI